MKVHNLALLFGSLTLFLLVGCATTREAAYLNNQIEDLQQEVEFIRGKLSSDMQKDWADIETTVEDLQREVKILRANVEEDRELIKRLADELEGLKRDYEAKISAYQKEKEEGVTVPPAPTTIPKERPTHGEEDMEGAYQRAYHTLKEGDYQHALRMFKEFLLTYPQSEYADNAQHWIGECYYLQGDYETAILEYEKVITRYPRGDKVSSALLKQGFAFLNLGDRVDAKILFKKVIKEYPRSPQAEIAAKKLKLLP
ncbi:MAG: tol-pal system protein YbgF [Deltaproteobacteria bacterium]|nr:tol-pal system protein YbgF [Deltaproteobacteria bacterium]